MGEQPTLVAVVVGVLLAAGLTAMGTLLLPPPPRDTVDWPTPDEMRGLSEYLAPAPEPVRGSATAGAVVDRDPFTAALVTREAPPGPTVPGTAAWRVTAILIWPDNRVAVVNGALVNPGDVLPGGARIASIERDSVVIAEPDGSRHTLRLQLGEGQ